MKIVKNKVAPPFKEVEFDVLYNEGISKLGDMIDVAVENNIIQKSGSWFSYGEDRIGQGRDAVKKYLTENPALFTAIETAVRVKLGISIGGNALAGAPATNGAAPVATNGSAKSTNGAPPSAPHPATASTPLANGAKKLSVKPA